MLSYIQVHLYFVIPPILVLWAIYRPLFGRRDVVKIGWLMLMATLYTTPWDNFILSYSGWGYPDGSIILKIWHVPLEEHMFFILQPLLLILLHSIVSLPQLLPFDVAPLLRGVEMPERTIKNEVEVLSTDTGKNGSWPTGVDMDDGEQLGPRRDENGKIRRRERNRRSEAEKIMREEQASAGLYEETPNTVNKVQTLPRRPLAALFWAGVFVAGFLLVSEAHQLSLGAEIRRKVGMDGMGLHAFYLGWILVWISPVLGGLTWLGGKGFGSRGDRLAWGLGAGWLCFVDTYAIRSGAWFITPDTSLDWQIWRGLPIEEFLFFLLTSHLVILSTSLITHIHTLLVLSPDLPPCPPLNPIKHVRLLAQVALSPPEIDIKTLKGLVEAEETLRKGSKSFDVAKLAFGREMRIGLVAVYAWCRVTDDLIDDSPLPAINGYNRFSEKADKVRRQAKNKILNRIVHHLLATYGQSPQSYLDDILDTIPGLKESDRSAFHLFSNLIPRLIPIDPFQELCHGYNTDMEFMILPAEEDHISSTDGINGQLNGAPNTSVVAQKILEKKFDPDQNFPIKTAADLNKYADNVAGSIASAICYLSWSILSSPSDPALALRPVDDLWWTKPIHNPEHSSISQDALRSPLVRGRASILVSARLMGRALQFVNISRDVIKDARIGRLYIPLSKWTSSSQVINLLLDASSTTPERSASVCSGYIISLLNEAEELRKRSEDKMELLPRTARGGMRAMVASYFEIGEEIKRRKGEVTVTGVRVRGKRRAGAAARAIWFGF